MVGGHFARTGVPHVIPIPPPVGCPRSPAMCRPPSRPRCPMAASFPVSSRRPPVWTPAAVAAVPRHHGPDGEQERGSLRRPVGARPPSITKASWWPWSATRDLRQRRDRHQYRHRDERRLFRDGQLRWGRDASHLHTVGRHHGSLSYTIPWDQVDATQASQALTPAAFNLNIAGHNFALGSASFTTAPTLLFANGDFVGVNFALDTSAVPGFPYSSLAMGGLNVTAIQTGTGQQFFATAESESLGPHLRLQRCRQRRLYLSTDGLGHVRRQHVQEYHLHRHPEYHRRWPARHDLL